MAIFQQVFPGGPSVCIEVDVTTNPTTGSRVWTDITSLCRRLEFATSGRSNELQRSNTGTLTCTVSNRGDALTGLGLRKRQWIRVRSQWLGVTYSEWQGILEAVPRSWPGYVDAVCILRAAGVFKALRLYPLDGLTRPAERNDQRVAAIAALASVPTTGFSTDTDPADAVTTPYATGVDALTTVSAIEESENGLLVETADGQLQFQGRHYRFLNSLTSRATFGESYPGQIPYRDTAEYSDDDTLLATVASVTPLGGTAVVVSNAAYGASQWVSTITRNLVSSSVLLATAAAQYLVGRYGNPSPRIPALSVDLPTVVRLAPSTVPAILSAKVSDRFTWTRAAPTPLTQDVYVEQIQESIAPGHWQLQFALSPAVDNAGWVLGSSRLGVDTVLTY